MNRLLKWYCNTTIWLLKRYSKSDEQAEFVESLVEDKHIGLAYRSIKYEKEVNRIAAEKENERLQFQKDKAEMEVFMKATNIDYSQDDWMVWKLGPNVQVINQEFKTTKAKLNDQPSPKENISQ